MDQEKITELNAEIEQALKKITDPSVKNLFIVLLNVIEEEDKIIRDIKNENQQLKNENNKLKGEQGKPHIK